MSTSGQSQNLMNEALTQGLSIRQQFSDRNRIVRTVRVIGGAMITILLVTLVLNEVFASVNVGSGAFSGISTDLQNTGVSAMGLLIVGLLVVAANRIMGIFGGGGGM
jgi:ABC-type antimicrobial peptide transport system permease subunit